MARSRLDLSDLIVPAFDINGQTLSLVIDVHPGQFRMLNYVVSCDRLPLHDRDGVLRWCIAWGLHTLLGPFPSAFSLTEAKMNVLQDDRFQQQKDYLAESVQKYLAAGEKENARRLVMLSFEEYCRIPNEYWRVCWLSTLNTAIEMLRQHGVRLDLQTTRLDENT